MTVTLQKSPYLPLQRNFPNDNVQALGVQLDLTYVDIAQKVNARTIGLFAVNLPSVTGESWYLAGQPTQQQTLRQVYVFPIGVGTTAFAHGIDTSQITTFTRIYGVANNGATVWLPVPFANVTALNFQIELSVDQTNIYVTQGAAQTMTQVYIVLEWLSKF